MGRGGLVKGLGMEKRRLGRKIWLFFRRGCLLKDGLNDSSVSRSPNSGPFHYLPHSP